MHLKDYFPTLTQLQRAELAAAARVTVGHLRNVMYGAPISESAVWRMEVFTKGRVTRAAHFPDYADRFPDLARKTARKIRHRTPIGA
jgi:hypothetical protein